MPAKTLIAVTLAFAAAAPALAQESLPTFRASVRTDANFPNPETLRVRVALLWHPRPCYGSHRA